MKGIDGGYKLSELLFGRGGSADAIVNVAAVELRFWAVVLAKKLMFDNTKLPAILSHRRSTTVSLETYP